MGNSSSALLPASEVLEMIAKDEKVAEKPTPVTDLPSPSSEDLCSALALLGVHMGDVPEAGEMGDILGGVAWLGSTWRGKPVR